MNWPDWTGETVAIVASGPSAKAANPAQLKGRCRVIAIKKTWELAPFADAVYGCDWEWWKSVRGLETFTGLKLAYDAKACDRYGLQRVLIPDRMGNALLFDAVGTVGAGGNSGFQVLNLAAQFGARRILLVGYDCHARGRPHWYGRNAWGMSSPGDDNFRRWIPAFETAAKQLAERGIEVVNASPDSDIKGFRKASVAETLHEWGLLEPA